MAIIGQSLYAVTTFLRDPEGPAPPYTECCTKRKEKDNVVDRGSAENEKN
jgi:hypothetical protein